MIQLNVIKNENEYQAALTRLSDLMDATHDSPEGSELEILAILIQKYEKEIFPVELPDPVEAIKFRMVQQGLSRKDLVQYIGSQSKVSEVLNRKKSLSLSMIRALHDGLGIPAEVLLQEPGKQLVERLYNPEEYPLKEMLSDGYFPEFKSLRSFKEHAEELLEQLFSPLDSLNEKMVLCRSSALAISNGHAVYVSSIEGTSIDLEKPQGANFIMDEKSLRAWQARVLQICETQNLPDFSASIMTEEFIRNLVRLSVFPMGPVYAAKALRDNGIHFVILPHLPKTYLDGACFKTASGQPVVGMTLRHDRLDNFWFTLMHELSHILLHLSEGNLAFFDETEHGLSHACNPQEVEANQLSMNLLISNQIWVKEKESLLASVDSRAVIDMAGNFGISPAIVAGRIRWETSDFSLYNDLLGSKSLKVLFKDPEYMLINET